MQGSIVLIYCPAFFDSNDLEADCYSTGQLIYEW